MKEDAKLPRTATNPGSLPVSQGVITKPSRFSVPETILRLESLVKAKGLTIFARVDHSGEAERHGLSMLPTQLLIFGGPETGTPLMNAFPLTAIDLPLKALAWQDKSGQVWLSYNDPAYLKQRHGMSEDLVRPLFGASQLIDAAG